MTRQISPLACVDARAELGDNIEIGPFCVIGPHVTIDSGCKLDSHVTIVGHTSIGTNNRFSPGAVIGGEPQDLSYNPEAPTQVIIGNDNVFREGVTIHRGAEKEDHITRVGHRNYFMANSHVGHNCHLHNNIILCNGALLGGHVHIYDYAIVSGNSAVHQFCSLGTMSFLGGVCRTTVDVPPYMMSTGNDDPRITSINLVGMQRRGISRDTIQIIKQAHRLIYRDLKPLAEVQDFFFESLGDVFPIELSTLLSFLEQTRRGKFGRAREAIRTAKTAAPTSAEERRAA